MPVQELEMVLRVLNRRDNVQRVAFGLKVAELVTGKALTMDSVKLSKKLKAIVDKYVEELVKAVEKELERDSAGGDNNLRCSGTCSQYNIERRCMREAGHSGRHKFTPKGKICPRMLKHFIENLSAGEIMSMAGLDDEDVIKGHNNFQKLRELARRISKMSNLDD